MEFDESVRIAGTPAEVYSVLADVQAWALGPGSPVKAMEKMPTGPTRVGTRWREVVRLAPRLSMTMWSEVTHVVPDRVLAMRFWGGSMEGAITYTVTAQGGGTVLRQYETMHAVGWLRPFDGLVGRMLRPRLRSRLNDIGDVFAEPARPR